MFSSHVMSCAKVMHSVPRYRSREFEAPWVAPGSWDCSWCWHPEPRSWSSSTLPPAPRERLAAKAHLTFLWAPLNSLGVEVNDKVAVGVIKIQPWGRTHGKIISSISNKHTQRTEYLAFLGSVSWHAWLIVVEHQPSLSPLLVWFAWCPTWKGGYYPYHFYGGYVRKVLQSFAVVYRVVEQLEIREALRDWCGELLPGGSTGVNLPGFSLPLSPPSLQYLFSLSHSLNCKIRLMMFSFPGTD